MKQKKSQAAMEFLITYGWAILVVLIAVGALAYFGVLSPDLAFPGDLDLYDSLVSKCNKSDSLKFVLCVVEAHERLNPDDCKDSANYYKYVFSRVNYLKNQKVNLKDHVFNIVEFDDAYCLIDGDYIQCITLKNVGSRSSG